MNDRELADRVVALGVGERHAYQNGDVWYELPEYVEGEDHPIFPAKTFVSDWRVAGAMMEKFPDFSYQWCDGCVYFCIDGIERYVEDKGCSLPRAIIEAACEALSDD